MQNWDCKKEKHVESIKELAREVVKQGLRKEIEADTEEDEEGEGIEAEQEAEGICYRGYKDFES